MIFVPDKWSFIEFNNKTDIPIYFIADTHVQDGCITPGSDIQRCGAKQKVDMTFKWKKGLSDIVKDSAYIYCLDARKIKLPWYYETLPDTTVNKAFIARMTYTPAKIRISFPQPENGYRTEYNPEYLEELGIVINEQ